MRYKKLKIQILSLEVSFESISKSDPKVQTSFRVCPKGIKSDSNESKTDWRRAEEKSEQQTTLPNIRRLPWHLIKPTGHQAAQLDNYGSS